MEFYKSCIIMFILLPMLGCAIDANTEDYVYSSDQYAFRPRTVESHPDGMEYYATDQMGGEYTGGEGSVPVFFCKFGNMIAVNTASFEKPWLWKVGNKVVVHTGDESDSPHLAHGKHQVVVMDADAGEMSVADVSASDIQFMSGVRRVEVSDHVVTYYNERGEIHKILIEPRHKLSSFARTRNLCAITDAVRRVRAYQDDGKTWIEPATGLEWNYVEIADGVEICNKRTGGTAVSPMPKGVVAFPESIDGKPVKSIGSNVILHCPVEKVCIPKTVERFSECAAYSLFNNSLQCVEVESGSRMFRSEKGLLYDALGSELLFVPCGLSKVEIPNSVTNISDSAFQHCEHIKRVVIPPGVQEIGRWALSQSGVMEVRFLGDAPKVPTDEVFNIYSLTATSLTTFVRKEAKGWRVNRELPTTWCGRPIIFE